MDLLTCVKSLVPLILKVVQGRIELRNILHKALRNTEKIRLN